MGVLDLGLDGRTRCSGFELGSKKIVPCPQGCGGSSFRSVDRLLWRRPGRRFGVESLNVNVQLAAEEKLQDRHKEPRRRQDVSRDEETKRNGMGASDDLSNSTDVVR